MSGCIFKWMNSPLCVFCEAKVGIEKAYNNNKEVDRVYENGYTKVFIYPKGNNRPNSHQYRYKGKGSCSCDD